MTAKLEFARLVRTLSYRDMMAIAEELSHWDLDEPNEIAEALNEVAVAVLAAHHQREAARRDDLIRRLSAYQRGF